VEDAMSIDELLQKNARERQELIQKQVAERNALQRQIEEVQSDLARVSTSLQRRSKELELESLRRKMTSLLADHARAVSDLERRQMDAVAELKSRLASELAFESVVREVEPMVKELLQEIAEIKHLQPSVITNTIPYQYEAEIGWLFKKKITETRYREERETISPVVIKDSPGSWSLGGKVPNGCTVIYRVTVVKSSNPYFKVEALSDARYQAIKEQPIGRKEMKGVTTQTNSLSRNELIDALLYVMSEVKEVCPCSTYPCPCPCAPEYCCLDCGPGADY